MDPLVALLNRLRPADLLRLVALDTVDIKVDPGECEAASELASKSKRVHAGPDCIHEGPR